MTTAFQTIGRGDHSQIVVPRRVVARDVAEWRAVWAAHSGPDAVEPAVDFDTRMIAAVFAGEQPSSGFGVTIAGSRRAGDGLVLLVQETAPGPGDMTAQVITSPFHIISLPRFDGQVDFSDTNASSVLTTVLDTANERVPRPPPIPATGRRRHDPAPSSTGLAPHAAGALAYLAGPFSGALLLATERTSRFVKFHAWQALLGLGTLLVASLVFLVLAFALLVVSATAFWTMLWIAALTAITWVAVWGLCLVQAYQGRLWKLPLLGTYAERRAGFR